VNFFFAGTGLNSGVVADAAAAVTALMAKHRHEREEYASCFELHASEADITSMA
jgi:hypothetical protein